VLQQLLHDREHSGNHVCSQQLARGVQCSTDLQNVRALQVLVTSRKDTSKKTRARARRYASAPQAKQQLERVTHTAQQTKPSKIATKQVSDERKKKPAPASNLLQSIHQQNSELVVRREAQTRAEVRCTRGASETQRRAGNVEAFKRQQAHPTPTRALSPLTRS
jgi:hypothetical protein